MEPMTLGSPIHSPLSLPQNSSITNPGGDTGTSGTYYPSYLMGEQQASVGLRVAPGSTSPTRAMRSAFSPSVGAPPSSPQTFRDVLPASRTTSERQTGPPTMGLLASSPFSTPPVRGNVNSLKEASIMRSIVSSPHTPTSQLSHNPSLYSNFEASTCEFDEDNVREVGRWVTVFAFPRSRSSEVLAYFSHIGLITDHKHPVRGNWLHIKFQNPLQARKALAKNGKIIIPDVMVAVSPLMEQRFLEDMNETNQNNSSISSPAPKDQIRSLTNSFHSPRQDKLGTPHVRTPQKSESLIAKAIQHFLGV